jgi:hypothetical protein
MIIYVAQERIKIQFYISAAGRPDKHMIRIWEVLSHGTDYPD